jgi:hypothetical protein
MAEALKALEKVLLRIAPWRMTGVRSIPEFEHYLPMGLEYRKFSPG